MAWDLAINYNTGDLILGPNKDFEARVGAGTIEQRIRVRLRVPVEEWALNPELGSRLGDLLRSPTWRATEELELIVREALAPMDDIAVQDVRVEEKDSRTVGFTIEYQALFTEDDQPIEDPTTLTTELELTVPVE